MPKKTTENKPAKKPARRVVPTDKKILQELKTMNSTLKELRDITDNIWRERRPQ